MRRVLLLIALLVVGAILFSCSRRPDVPPGLRPHPTSGASTDAPQPPPSLAQNAPGSAAATAAVASEAQAAVSVLHAYLALIPGDLVAADRYWANGRPTEDDRVLRQLTGASSMRIDTGRPEPLDAAVPPSAFQIPVRLRLSSTSGGTFFNGHYRLRARHDAQGWEITSAQLEQDSH